MVQFQNSSYEPSDFCEVQKYSVQKISGSWKCIGPVTTYEQNANYHLGCKKIHLDPGELEYVHDGEMDLPQIDCIKQFKDPVEDIQVSEQRDNDPNTWDITSYYVDILRGVDCDLATECTEATGVNVVFGPTTPSGGHEEDYKNIWANPISRIVRGDDDPPISISTVDVGNWVTMSAMDNYEATLVGRLYGARTGSSLILVYPRDTAVVDSVVDYDTATFVVPQLSGCIGDTVDVNLDFMVPSYPAYMYFMLQMPNDNCGNPPPNGLQVQFLGDVVSRGNTAVYDTGAYMYGINVPFLRDTTPPSVNSVETWVLDPSTLRIRIVGSEDTSMIDGAWIDYRVNGGAEKTMFMRYEDSVVGNATAFLDTLFLSEDSATVTFQAFVRNGFEETGESAMDTCQVYGLAPLGVEPEERNRRRNIVLRHSPNPVVSDATIEYGVPEVTNVRLEIYSSEGERKKVLVDNVVMPGSHLVMTDLSDLPNGVYQYVLTTDFGTASGKLLVQH
jgi:hypothetical protein